MHLETDSLGEAWLAIAQRILDAIIAAHPESERLPWMRQPSHDGPTVAVRDDQNFRTTHRHELHPVHEHARRLDS
jgi:hypothetical protein